jgi:2-aminoethylphosphonate-pyruvate transaminase
MGFKEYLRPEDQGYIITSFLCPEDPRFTLDRFYDELSQRGFVIYPGKVSTADCFRIGSLGRIFPSDMEDLLAGIHRTLEDMGISVPLGAS